MTWHRHKRPPWWPVNEPWPPRFPRRHGPPQFMRGLGCMFAAMLLFTAFGLSLLTRAQKFAIAIAIGVMILFALTAAFSVVLRRVARRLRAENEIRRQLMADVAHELRTPLAILQGRIEGLLDGVYQRDDARLNELLDETRHLSRLVEDLRTLSNAEAGALDLRKEPTDIADLIRDAAASLDAPIEIRAPEDVPHIDIDPVRIREVLLNLLSNAIQHADAVSISAQSTSQHITIRVIDKGPGISAEDLPRIFDRFTKGKSSRGSGLGLAISRSLVLAHGGTIHAESRVGEGTTVTVTLPR